MRSESTSAFGQPRLTNPTLGARWDIGKTSGNGLRRVRSLVGSRLGGGGMRGMSLRSLLHRAQNEEHRERNEGQQQPRPHSRATLGSQSGGGLGGVGRHGGG